MKCTICGSEELEKIYAGLPDREYGVAGGFDFKLCRKCQLLFMDPMPATADLLGFYPADYHGYGSPPSRLTEYLIKMNLKNRADLYGKLIGNNGLILDVGSADGYHFDVLNQFGNWQFVGVEFNDEVAQAGRKQGREIYTSTIEDFNFGERSFDLIIMNHLIEHVTDPNATIASASRILRTGGFIVGETPNTDSWDYRIFGKYWGGMHTPRHTHLFSPQSLRVLLENNGLILDKIEFSLDTSHWALSIQHFLQDKKWTKIELVHGRTFYYPLLLLALLPMNIIQRLFRATGVIRFIARKP